MQFAILHGCMWDSVLLTEMCPVSMRGWTRKVAPAGWTGVSSLSSVYGYVDRSTQRVLIGALGKLFVNTSVFQCIRVSMRSVLNAYAHHIPLELIGILARSLLLHDVSVVCHWNCSCDVGSASWFCVFCLPSMIRS